jgi:hypothetical protein
MDHMYTNSALPSTEIVEAFFDFAQTNELALVRVHTGQKEPVGEEWQDAWNKDRAEWEIWRREGFNIGIHAGASGVVTFDLDSKHGGIDAVRARFGEWFIALGVGRLPHHVETPSGGQHILMRLPEGIDPKTLKSDTRGMIVGKGVDVLTGNRQSVAPGSYFNGVPEENKPAGFYTFHAAPIYGVPENVLAILKRRAVEVTSVPNRGKLSLDGGKAFYKWMADEPNFIECDDDWREAGMCAKVEWGSDGLAVWEILATGEDGISAKSLKRWNSFASEYRPGDVQINTLMWRAHQAGWEGSIGLSFEATFPHDVIGPAAKADAEKAKAAAAAALEALIPTPPAGFIQSSGQFLAGYKPADYLIRPIFQRRYLYSITAQTDTGKTTVALRFAAHVATGIAIDDNVTCKKGTVLYFCGENPDDVRTRWLGLTRDMGIDPVTTDVHFVSGAMHLSKVADRITQEVTDKKLEPALVVVDTSAAYFETDNESDPIQALQHAKRMRSLTLLPGGPCVLALCHPTKNAKDDELIPRGGSGFVNEVDGNCALRRSGDTVSGEKLGKFRGPSFSPFSFELVTIWDHPQIVDSDGLPMPTVICRPISTAELHRVEEIDSKDDVAVLNVLCAHRGIKQADIAKALDWFYRTGAKQGKPNGSKVRDALKRLQKKKYVEEAMNLWTATAKGQKVATLVDSASMPSQQMIARTPANLGSALYPAPRMVAPPPMPPAKL